MERDPLFRADLSDAELRQRVEEGLVDELGSRSLTGASALFCLLPFLPGVLGEAGRVPGPVRGALLLLGALLLVRLATVLGLRVLPRERLRTRARKAILVVGSTLVAAGLALLNFVAVPLLDDTHVALLAVCHAGIASVALVSMAGSLGAYLAYVALNLGSLLFSVGLFAPDPVHRLLAGLILLYLASLAVLSFHVHTGLRRRIRLSLELGEAALRDTLTGLRNRRSLADTMTTLSARTVAAWSGPSRNKRASSRESLSILVLDVDHFKRFNDRYSHAAGDAVLVQFAERLRDQVRREDLAVRWGGEEFVVVAGTERESVNPLAERIRKSVSGEPFRLPNGLMVPVTCSVGYSLFPYSTERPEVVTWEEVLKVADLALRTAKQRGRNCSVGILCGAGALATPETAKSLVEGNLERAEEEGLVQVALRGEPLPA